MFPRLLLLLSIAAVFGACREPSAQSPDGGSSTDASVQIVDAGIPGLRIATLNLRCLLEEWDARVPLIVEELAALNPDVIALQEVCRIEGGADALPDFISRLQNATGESYEFSRAETHVAWDVYQEGIALLSRHSLEGVEIVDLPVGVFPRKAVVARIAHPSVPTVVAVTHLSFGDQESVREKQLAALRSHLLGRQATGTSLLIAGDFNEGPTGNALQAATAAGYLDSWAHLHPDNDGPTYPASAPQSRLDYVLFSPTGPSTSVLQSQRFLQESTQGRYPSDHLGLWVDLGPTGL